jgi:hypothetical protein
MIAPTVGAAEQNGGANQLAFEAYGVRLAVSASRPELMDRVRQILPPAWRPIPDAAVESRFGLEANDFGTFVVTLDGEQLSGSQSVDLDLALELLEAQLRLFLGTWATETTFIHAGAVAHHGKAIITPGTSFAGKTTLVAALVRVGAIYYSDEFAVLTQEGLVVPYAKPLSLREDGGWDQTDHAVESLGGAAGDGPIPIGMIVSTSYQPDAKWEPRRLSSGAGAMRLLENAVPAQERPQQVMRAVRLAADGALVLEGDRGEADEVAPLLLAELERYGG